MNLRRLRCTLLPHREADLLTGQKRWRFGHEWEIAVHGPGGTAFECKRCRMVVGSP